MSDSEQDYEPVYKSCGCHKTNRVSYCRQHLTRLSQLHAQLDQLQTEWNSQTEAVREQLTKDCEPINDELYQVRTKGKQGAEQLYALLQEHRVRANTRIQELDDHFTEQRRPLQQEMQEIKCFRSE